MHARLLTAQVSPEKIDEFIQLWHTGILSTYKEEQGWKSARLLVDRQAGKVALLSLWDTDAPGLTGGTGGALAQKIHGVIGHLLAARPVAEDYDVAGDA